jgi:AraC-like DNA-binding protein
VPDANSINAARKSATESESLYLTRSAFNRKEIIGRYGRQAASGPSNPDSAAAEGYAVMTSQRVSRISRSHLDSLITALQVNFVKLTECLVSPGWRLALAASKVPGIHYNLRGMGRLIIGGQPPIELLPHTLVIVPSERPFVIEGTSGQGPVSRWRTVEGQWRKTSPGTLHRFVAGDGEPQIMLICGYFQASFGGSIDLFSVLPSAIVEQFDLADQLDHKLKSAVAELVAQEVGMGVMTTTLLKQVLVSLLRRSLSSNNLWIERFSLLGDPHVARAFADMVARPGAPHSIHSLSKASGLSRSAFMARFTAALNQSPMAVLRQLRMRHAVALMTGAKLSTDRVAREAGYASRSSFLRAFRKATGRDPSEYRAAALHAPTAES